MPRVIVFGIDGASLDIVKKLGLDKLPNLHRLMASGVFSPMLSPLPITPAAWTSIATGVNPGRHGVGDFIVRQRGSYRYAFANRTMRKEKAYWNVLSAHGHRNIVLNYPVTYPPEKINGVMVSGMLTPDLDSEMTYPSDYKEKLMEYSDGKYKIFINTPFEGAGDGFLDDALKTMTIRGKTAVAMAKEEEWDIFTTVFMGVDIASHMFYHIFDEGHPRHSEGVEAGMRNGLEEAYRAADRILGDMLKVDHDNIIVISDHGFGPLHYYVNLNYVLETAGLLKYGGFLDILGKRKGGYDRINWRRTKAYSLGVTSPINLNLRGRDPMGVVASEEIPDVIGAIGKALGAIKRPDTGQPVLERLVPREEFAKGPNEDLLPDYIALMDDMRVIGKGLTYEDIVFSRQERREIIYPANETGTHAFKGFLCVSSRNTDLGGREIDSTLYDVAPTLYDIFNVNVKGLDGSSVLERAEKEE